MKKLLMVCLIGLLSISRAAMAEPSSEKADIVVYRSPTCLCCGKWVRHLKDNDFNVQDIVTDSVDAVKAQHGVPGALASCHTALVGGYVIEGHVPANDIKKLLANRPQIAGIAVPGMPLGTPGMEMGGHEQPYEVIAFDKENHRQVFSTHGDE
ncbi:MAG: CopG family transcriptional regulator [Gammaproteobacteria bacterium HGW-Gammaproteobacteria-3]|nr:MAG: CopG family transcriptional regulator [Gammaproteobacteria bacterium HGW-Gammaproteobacteria-3]